MDKKMECVLLHGWGLSNTVWQGFADQLSGFDKVTAPCLYEIARETKDNKLESVAEMLSNKIKSNSLVVAWSIGGLIATQLAGISNKVKAIVYVAAPPCFINKQGWSNVIDKKNIDDLQRTLLNNTDDTLKYFSGLVAHGDNSIKETNQMLRKNLADEKNKTILLLWLKQMKELDQTEVFSKLNLPIQIILSKNDSLINSKAEKQIKQLNVNVRSAVINECGHAPFISKAEETAKTIDRFVNAEFG